MQKIWKPLLLVQVARQWLCRALASYLWTCRNTQSHKSTSIFTLDFLGLALSKEILAWKSRGSQDVPRGVENQFHRGVFSQAPVHVWSNDVCHCKAVTPRVLPQAPESSTQLPAPRLPSVLKRGQQRAEFGIVSSWKSRL